ncbi:MAG: DUF188 domain-containing protein [Sporolactobacillus sp.]|jgi:uncharacterized protein YaiI (UPF0178 family)|nr:DUF188 domain-containing protein [Sporolactobacillus sp.]MCI1881528.1 DUF188 domain-containing protein [Sporolactobacillus sp.]
MSRKILLYVDADACPVKTEIASICVRFDVQPIFVASYAGYHEEAKEKWVFVDQRKEAADLYIINHAVPGDIAVTQDMGLAAVLSGRGVFVLTTGGRLIREGQVPSLLQRRYLVFKTRRSGGRLRGPHAFTQEAHKKFSAALTKLLCRLIH